MTTEMVTISPHGSSGHFRVETTNQAYKKDIAL